MDDSCIILRYLELPAVAAGRVDAHLVGGCDLPAAVIGRVLKLTMK
jgi:hypothetical protein